MKKIYVLLAAVFLLMGCKVTEKSAASVNKGQEGPLSVHLNSEYESGERIKIEIKNNSNGNIDLMHPKEIVIQKQTETGWKNVPILYCPCGASCPAPPEKIQLTENAGYTMVWDQKTSWCKESNALVPETIEKQVEPGSYRVLVEIMKEVKSEKIYKEFTIK